MKSTTQFKTVIETKLQQIASEDPLFANSLLNPKKNIDDCITFILNSVKKSGCNGFTDEEIFGMAMHYYDEENINVGDKITCSVVVNHKPELTEEEIAKAKKEALDKIIEEERKRLTQRNKPKTQSSSQEQLSLL